MANKIIQGMREAIAYAKGENAEMRDTFVRTPTDVDVKAIRERLQLSQEAFARQFGFSVGSVRNWEQHHRRPDGPARTLLKVIENDPQAVLKALST